MSTTRAETLSVGETRAGSTGEPRIAGLIRRHPVVAFFVLAYALTWAGQVPVAAASHGLLPFAVPAAVGVLAAYGPALAAVILTAALSGTDGLRELGAWLGRWRVGWRWYVFALFGPAAIYLSTLAVHVLLGGALPDFAAAPIYHLGVPFSHLWQLVPATLLMIAVGPDGVGEETGWRGFALPRLQAGRSALGASLLLGFVWACWHLPIFWTQGGIDQHIPFLLFLLEPMANSVLATWLYNGTGGSLLLAILFHAAGNTTGLAIPVDFQGDLRLYGLLLAARWVVVLVLVLVAGPARLSRRARVPATKAAEPDERPRFDAVAREGAQA